MSKRHSSNRNLVVSFAILAIFAVVIATNWAGIFGPSASAKQQKQQIDNSDPRTKVEALIDRSANPNQGNEVYDASGKLMSPHTPEAAPPSSDNLITAGTYAFAASAGAALEDMSSGTTTLDGNNFDDQQSGLTAMPFDFWFDGVRATQFSINANGEIRLGNTQIATSFTNSLASVTDAPKLAVYWDDLWIGFNGKVHYKTIGSAPNRKMVVEWQNMQVPRVANGSTGGATFQAWLYEGSGVIEYVYGAGMAINSTNSGYSVGIQSGVATNFAAVTTSTGTVSYAAANDTQTNAIASGTKYTFTPTAPTAPSGLNFTGVTGTSETLNWTDTSSNEAGFLIYRSTDGANYTFITQTAANAVTSIQNNLGNNQTYSWRVIAVSEGAVSSTLSGSQATTTGTVSGTKSVGPTGTYLSLTAAFADITTNGLGGNVILELQSTYLSAVETFPIVPSAIGSPSATITVRPAAGATGLSITGNNATAIFDLSGSSYVTIDGEPGGVGATKDMTIANTGTGSVIRLINGASFNTFKFLKILGVNTSATAGGDIFFSTSTSVVGNSNNNINNNDIRDGATAPVNGICSTGTTTLGLENSNNSVSNNNIFNFFSPTADHNGIILGTGSTTWTISGNSFYNTNGPLNITGTSFIWNGIRFSSATGNWGHNVTGNFIGGTAPSGGGGALTFTGIGVIRATQLTTGTQISTSLQGNTIGNFNLTSSSAATGGAGLGMVTGAFNAGDITPNIISNWTINITTAATLWRGISAATGTAGITVVSNNVVSNITNASTSQAQVQGIGIQGVPQAMTVSGNTVGSTSVANSISMSAAAVSFFGITSSATGAASYVYSNNTVANVTSTGTGAFNMVGMSISGGGYSITGNTVRNLTTASTTTASTIVGINATSSTASINQFLSGNTIRSCNSTAPAAGVVLFGIIYSGPTTGASVVSRNLIHSIAAATTSTAGEIDGIRLAAGNATFQNNMVRLGFFDDATPTSMTTGLTIGGLVETGGTNNVYHNSIYIGGTGVVSVSNTGAFLSTLTAGTRAIRDNIFANNRQNASGTAANTGVLFFTALTLPSPAGLTMSNNVYFSFDPAGSIRNGSAGTLYSVSGWQGASAIDASSIYATLPQINFVNAEGTATLADPFPKITSPSAVVDLHIVSPTVIESSGIDVGVLDDFDGQTRASLTPVDIGADAGSFTAVDLTPPNITYTPLASTASTANRVLSTTIADATGVAAGANLPRIYFKKSTDAVYVSTQCVMTGGTAQNGTYDCTINHSLVGGGGVTTNDIVQYFVIAQDTAGTPNVGSNPGGVVATNVNSVTTPPTPNSYTILPTLSGKKTVGAGGDYPTLTAALAAVNGSVVNGAVQLTLIDATYPSETFPLVLNANPGSSATNTITIKPLAAVTPTISGVSAGCVLNLNGADWTIVDGSNTVGGVTRDLTVANTGVGTSSAVICMTSTGVGAGATNNVIKNVNVAGTSVTATPTTLAGIFSGSSTISITSAGADNDNNTIQNNSITKTTYGIYSGGASAANKNTGTVITENVMNAVTPNNITTGGIHVIFDDGVQITRNDIGNIVKNDGTVGTTGTVFGIALGVVPSNTVTTFTGSDVVNGLVSRNKINALTQLNSTGYSSFGIVINSVTSGTTQVANNMISQVISASTASDFSGGIIAGGGAGSTTQIYYNSVSMTGLRNAASFPSYGLAINSGNPIVDVRNNIFYNTQTTSSTGKSYAIANASTTFTNMTSNHNDLFVSGATAFIGQTGGLGTSGTDRLTLADWQTATGQDTTFAPESISADPLFTSASDLHILGGSPAINAGSTIAGIANDFDGDFRPAGTAAEIGADELSDVIAPDTTMGTTPSNPSNSSSATFTFSGTDSIAPSVAPEVVTSFECKLDAAAFATCVSPVNLIGLADGSHTFQVRAKDGSGNVDASPASFTWTIDTTAPDTSITSNPTNPTNNATGTFSFTGNDGAGVGVASFECKLDAGAFAACTSPQAYPGLSEGSHTFQVRAIDGVGNVDASPASFTWVVDTIAPNTNILTNPTDPSGSTSATFTFSGTDARLATVGSFECKLDAGAFAACTSPQTYLGLSAGSHTFQVRAIDTAGNVDATPASYTWMITLGGGGPVTVTATAGTTGPTDYATLKLAIDAINAGTHQGAVTVSVVSSTTEVATSVLNSSGAGAAVYTSVLIRPTTDGVTVAGPSVLGSGLIELNGADNVTIDGDNPNTGGTNRNLTIQNTAVNTTNFTSVIRIALAATIVTSADNCTIKNLILLGSATGRNIALATSTANPENTTYGIVATGGASTVSATTAPTPLASTTLTIGTGATANNLTIQNNSITTVARAVAVQGSAATVFPGLLIENNSIGNAVAGNADQVYSMGVTAQGTNNAIMRGNTVYVESFLGTGVRGIEFGSISATGTTALIEKNKVLRVRNNNPGTFGAYGINLGGGSTHTVQNNFVADVKNDQTTGTGAFSTTFGAFGIRVASGIGHKVLHNSVHMFGLLPGTVSTDLTAAMCIAAVGQQNMDVRNNIFSNQLTGGNPTGTRHASINLPTGATVTMNLTENNNAYYQGTDANSRMAITGATFGAGEYLAANFDPTTTAPATNFRAYTSPLSAAGTNDNASFATTTAPPFTSNLDLHIPAGTVGPLESGGAGGTGVTVDIDMEVRNATPDIGADEFVGVPPPANDIAAIALILPANGAALLTGTSVSPQASFKNVGTAAQVNVNVQFTMTGPGGYNYSNAQVIPTINPGQTITVTFAAAPTFTTQGAYVSGAAVTTADANAGNDTIAGAFTVSSPFNGTYTVGSGGNFPSLTNPGGIFESINSLGATGNIVINITSDLTGENGGVALNEVAGGFTVTIKPTGAARSITGSSSLGIIRINGADGVTIDGSLSGGTATGVGGTPSLRNLTVQNTSTTATAGCVIHVSQGPTNSANNNTIKNVNVIGQDPTQTLIGIDIGGNAIGAAPTINNNNVVVDNCSFQKSFIAIFDDGATTANQATGSVISHNDISATGANRMRRAGIFLFNQNGIQVTDNLIGGIVGDEAADAIGIIAGIQNVTTTNVTNGGISNALISRNKISVSSTNTTGFSASGIAIAGDPAGSNTISNNMITGVSAPSTAPDLVAGIFVAGVVGSNTKVYHNSVAMTGDRGAVASQIGAYAIAISGTNPTVELKNNIFYTTQTSGGGANAKSYAIGMQSTTFTSLNSNFNDFFLSGANAAGFRTGSLDATGTDFATLALWTGATTQDAGSFSVDPLFVDPLTDLHLQAGSTMINAATTGTGVVVDIDGDTRPSGPASDIGADEIVVAGGSGVLQFSAPTYTIGEAGVNATITVTRTGGTGTIGVSYATVAGGSATAGGACGGTVDYVTTAGMLSFPDANSQSFSIPICSDSLDEADETVNLALSLPTGGATIGTQGTAVLTITDDDATPSLAIASPSPQSQAETNVGSHQVTFNVNLSAASGQTVTVHYQTNDGSATTANNDYVGISDTIMTFNPGETSKPIPVTVNGDFTPEPDESFTVSLSTPVNATIGTSSASATILNDDGALSTFSINDVRTKESNAGTHTVTFTVSLFSPGSPPGFASVQYATGGGTATPGASDPADYVSASGTLTFGAADVVSTPDGGSTQTRTFTVTIIGDVNKEPNETFFVTLSNPNNGVIGDGTGSCVINDEDRAYVADFDRDLKTDLSVFRPVGEFVDGIWYVNQSSNGVTKYDPFGANGDKIVPGDYDADGVTDFAVFRPSTAIWYIQRSSDFAVVAVQWGQATDLPVQGDYDGDDKADIAVFRPSTGTWYVLRSSDSQLQAFQWGASGDKVVPGDYDGDGKNDFAVFRPSAGTWFVQPNTDVSSSSTPWGQNGDIPVAGDFDGDGKADIAVFRPSDGNWYISTSLKGTPIILHWGQGGDIPVVGDYDADGISDIAVWRPSTGDWYILGSNDPAPPLAPDAVLPIFGHWGQSGDKPVPASYVPEQ